MSSSDIVKHKYKITVEDRNHQKKHKSFLIWFTGLSGSGKSTLADQLEQLLISKGIHTYVLDGDNIRKGVNNDLDFSPEHRRENIRRIAEISKLFIDAGVVVLAAFISPYKDDRELVAQTVGKSNFIEVFVNTSLQECKKRDGKGLYSKAEQGLISNFTGVTAPYEAPMHPDITISEDDLLIDSINKIYCLIEAKVRNCN